MDMTFRGESKGGGGVQGDPLPFWGTPELYKEGKNASVRAKTLSKTLYPPLDITWMLGGMDRVHVYTHDRCSQARNYANNPSVSILDQYNINQGNR